MLPHSRASASKDRAAPGHLNRGLSPFDHSPPTRQLDRSTPLSRSRRNRDGGSSWIVASSWGWSGSRLLAGAAEDCRGPERAPADRPERPAFGEPGPDPLDRRLDQQHDGVLARRADGPVEAVPTIPAGLGAGSPLPRTPASSEPISMTPMEPIHRSISRGFGTGCLLGSMFRKSAERPARSVLRTAAPGRSPPRGWANSSAVPSALVRLLAGNTHFASEPSRPLRRPLARGASTPGRSAPPGHRSTRPGRRPARSSRIAHGPRGPRATLAGAPSIGRPEAPRPSRIIPTPERPVIPSPEPVAPAPVPVEPNPHRSALRSGRPRRPRSARDAIPARARDPRHPRPSPPCPRLPRSRHPPLRRRLSALTRSRGSIRSRRGSARPRPARWRSPPSRAPPLAFDGSVRQHPLPLQPPPCSTRA